MTNHPLARDLEHVLSHTSDVWESLRGQSLFITGGTGFVGTWLLESLCWADDKFDLGVNAVVLTRNPAAFRAKAPYAGNHRAVRFVQGDAASFDFPAGEFSFVIHAATERSKAPETERPLATFDADLLATTRVLEFARTHGARRLLFTSSGAVYGTQPAEIEGISEEFAGAPDTMSAKSAYGEAKRASEFLCAQFSRQFGFAALIARMFAFVGPHLPLNEFAVGNFVRDAVEGRTIQIESDGSTVRSYLYAADLAIWLWTILAKGESARPYNVGSQHAVSIRELAKLVACVAGGGSKVEVLGRPGVPSTRYVPEVLRAEKELGLAVHVSLEESLGRTIAWHRS